ncbi:MAG TPA: hypothetical protein VF065_13040 [Ilumatobacter sp.]
MHDGERIIRADLILTAIFGVTAAYAAIDFSTAAQWVGAVTAMTLFTIGVFAFLWSYWLAVQRSRVDEISVSQLYLLLGPAIPRRVRRTLMLTLLAQAAIATITTFARPDGPDGNPGSSLAVGFLVPMLGFGLNGLWAVTHGRFAPRSETVKVTTSAGEIGQNADHG